MSDNEDVENKTAHVSSDTQPTTTNDTTEANQAIREDQIANAVAFLSHPKVRGSPVASKRQFLKNKGLTEAEIDEAFTRVPETSVSTAPAPSATLTTTANHLQPTPYMQAPPPQHQQQLTQQSMHQHHPPGQQPVHWGQVAMGAGFTAAGAYAVKSLVWPYISDTCSSWRGRRPRSTAADGNDAAAEGTVSEVEGSVAVNDETAHAVAEAIKEQTSELREAIHSIQEVAKILEEKGSKGDGVAGTGGGGALTAHDLRQELRAFAATMSEQGTPGRSTDTTTTTTGLETELAEIKSLLTDYLKTPRSGSRTPTEGFSTGGGRGTGGVVPSTLASAIHRANSSIMKTPLTGASSQATSTFPSPLNNNNNTFKDREASTEELRTADSSPFKAASSVASYHSLNSTLPDSAKDITAAAKPASYMEVLEMLEKGETPPGIRSDINDKPPNPEQPPPQPKLRPLPKPWERSASASEQRQGGEQQQRNKPASLYLPDDNDDGGNGGQHHGENGGGGELLSHVSPSTTSAGGTSSKPSSSISFNPTPREPFSNIVTSSGSGGGGSSTNSPQRSYSNSNSMSISPSGGGGGGGSHSIYEAAVAPNPGSPHIIAGRFSPTQIPTGSTTSSTSNNNNSNPRKLNLDGEAEVGSRMYLPEGNGLGRPFLRAGLSKSVGDATWKPPAVPQSSLSSSRSGGGAVSAPVGGDDELE